MQYEKISRCFNVSGILLDYIDENKMQNLSLIATSGGCDYIFRDLGNGREAIIAERNEASSPKFLSDPCDLIIFDDGGFSDESIQRLENDPRANNWLKGINMPFSCTREALKVLNNMEAFDYYD